MRTLNSLALTFVVLGGLNWGMVGLFNIDLVQMLVGTVDQTLNMGTSWGAAWGPVMARIFYMLIGASAIYCLVALRALAAPQSGSSRLPSRMQYAR